MTGRTAPICPIKQPIIITLRTSYPGASTGTCSDIGLSLVIEVRIASWKSGSGDSPGVAG